MLIFMPENYSKDARNSNKKTEKISIFRLHVIKNPIYWNNFIVGN